MKSVGSMVLVAVLLMLGFQHLPVWVLGGQTAPRTASFVGVIMDSKCARVGSHDAIMKKIGATDARDCTLKCAQDGSFVLYDPEAKKVYQLDDQQKPVPFAGQKVRITGPYDEWSQTIEIDSIEPSAGSQPGFAITTYSAFPFD